MIDLNAHWQGKPCIARLVRVIVGRPTPECRWCFHLEGKERSAVEVVEKGKVFYLDNESGAAWLKVTQGLGSDVFESYVLPVRAVVKEL